MGIQAYVEIKDLERLGVEVRINSTDFYDIDPEGNKFLDYTQYEAEFFVCGECYYMHTDAKKESMWVDVNWWSENRARYIPMFKALGVKYEEG